MWRERSSYRYRPVTNWWKIKNKQYIPDKCNEYLTNLGALMAEETPTTQGSPNHYLKGMYRNSSILDGME